VQTSAKIWSKANATQPPYAACFEPTNQRHLCRRLQKPTQIRREDRAVAQSVLCRRLHRIVLRGPYVRSSIHSYSGFLSKELQFSLCLLQTSARQFGGGSVPCADNCKFFRLTQISAQTYRNPVPRPMCRRLQMVEGITSQTWSASCPINSISTKPCPRSRRVLGE
jgi:hypothetical protein